MPDNGAGSPRHFLDLAELRPAELRRILNDAVRRKADWKAGRRDERPLADRAVALIFDKPSTRTRISFDVGVRQLGGESLVLSGSEMHLGAAMHGDRGETMADTARVLSRFVDAIMLRTTAHERLTELAAHASVPVINGLTDDTHPCQIMADVMTFEEHRGPIEGRTLAWVGDGNNVTASLMEGARALGYRMRIATPEGREPDARFRNDHVELGHDPGWAVSGADAVIADTFVSMGDSVEGAADLFAPYQVNAGLMERAGADAIFMHCLPAHRGEEVTDEVMDGPRSVVFDEAENRLHVQKSILVWCLAPDALDGAGEGKRA